MNGSFQIGASTDLNLGNMLDMQRRDETDEQRKKRQLGLSGLNSPLNFGRTGIASVDLGYLGGGRT